MTSKTANKLYNAFAEEHEQIGADTHKGQILLFLEGTPAKLQIQPSFQLLCLYLRQKIKALIIFFKFNMITFI